MSTWVALRAEWRDAAELATYTLTVPAPWRAEGVLLFSAADAPLSTPQLQRLNNAKIHKRAMLRVSEQVASAVPVDDDVDAALRAFLASVLQLKPEHAAALDTASVAQVCALVVAVFEHPTVADAGLPPLRDAVE
eukprot:gene10671-22621_t